MAYKRTVSSTVLILLFTLIFAAEPAAAQQNLEPGRSSVRFIIYTDYFQLAGSAKKYWGKLSSNFGDLTRAKIEVGVDLGSVVFDVGRPEDTPLGGLFSKLENRTVQFYSQTIKRRGPGIYVIDGTVVHGKARKKVSVPVNLISTNYKESRFEINYEDVLSDLDPRLKIPFLEGARTRLSGVIVFALPATGK